MASKLKKWLKKEDLYDVALESALSSQGVTNPATDFALYTQSEWDELYTKCVVERAKELKDQRVRQRFEAKLSKLEKHWRTQSGIKKSSIKTSQKKGASKAATAKALKEAVGLRKYLQK